MESSHSISSLLNSTIRNLKRSHDQISGGALNEPASSHPPYPSASSAPASTRSIFGAFPSFSMPNLPNLRFAGDGFDYRRPAPTAPAPNAQEVIDLTEDQSPEVHRHGWPNSSAISRHYIDVDEERTGPNVGSSNQSPDLELLEVRSIRSQHANVPEARQREHPRPRPTLRPPHTDNAPFAVGGWNGLRQHAQGQGQVHRRNHDTTRRFHELLHTNHPHPRHEMLIMHQDRPGIILPGDLDFVTQGFQMGDVTTRQQQPALPTYEAPPPARQGFTRSPKEDDVLICPNCGEELGTGKEETKRQVWIIKACGHVYCGECASNRSTSAKKGKGSRAVATKPFSRCVVEGCGNKKIIAGPRSLFQIYL